MDLRLVAAGRKVYVQIRDWDPRDLSLYYALLPYLRGCCVFADGAIGGGKSTFIDYIQKCVKMVPAQDSDGLLDMCVFPEPIGKVREITALYYDKKLSLSESNKQIVDICTKPWMTQMEKYVGGTYLIERLPPPFRTWVFEKGFDTSYEKEYISTMSEGKKVIDEYNNSNKLAETLNSCQQLKKFKNVMAVIVAPPTSRIMKQISRRGRKEEETLSIGYVKYLNSKFERVCWEVFDREKEIVTTPEAIEKFPL
jgi:hypothetical protein